MRSLNEIAKEADNASPERIRELIKEANEILKKKYGHLLKGDNTYWGKSNMRLNL